MATLWNIGCWVGPDSRCRRSALARAPLGAATSFSEPGAGRDCERDRKNGPAGCPELAAPAPDGVEPHQWGTQRRTVATEPGSGRLEPDAGSGGAAFSRQSAADDLPVLASGVVQGAESVSRVMTSGTIIARFH